MNRVGIGKVSSTNIFIFFSSNEIVSFSLDCISKIQGISDRDRVGIGKVSSRVHFDFFGANEICSFSLDYDCKSRGISGIELKLKTLLREIYFHFLFERNCLIFVGLYFPKATDEWSRVGIGKEILTNTCRFLRFE